MWTEREYGKVRVMRSRDLAGPVAKTMGVPIVAALLISMSIVAGLQFPATQYLTGYPAAARLGTDRPVGGFIPLTARYISKVLGIDGAADGPSVGGRPAAASRGGADGSTLRGSGPRVAVTHPFTNDDFANAYKIPAVPFTARTTTREATRDPAEPSACAPVGGTAWYRYTPTADERLVASTLGSDHALALGVFAGERLGSLRQVGCGNGPTGHARVGFRASERETYYFQITGVAGGGNLVFSLDAAGRTERVSVSSTGEQADYYSYRPSISADGRYVAFNSLASNLTPDQRRCPKPAQVAGTCDYQVFLHDRETRMTSLVSVSTSGEPANGQSALPSISDDGRYVAFLSTATNLAPNRPSPLDGTTEARSHVYVRDRVTGITEQVSMGASGQPGTGDGSYPSISADGRHVAFVSGSPDHAGAPQCGPLESCPAQVYVRDRVARTTVHVSRGIDGRFGNRSSYYPGVSADGTVVTFSSTANNLVPGDANGGMDVFARDLRANSTELISVTDEGRPGNMGGAASNGSGRYVSADGRYVAFLSDSTDLVPGDTNQATDFFVRDRVLRTTRRVNVSSAGAEGRTTASQNTSGTVAISGDGRFVAFDASMPNLADDDAAEPLQVYVRDLLHGTTTRVSVDSLGEPANYHSFGAAFSARGDVVAFSSSASNLVPNDTNRGCVAPRNTSDSCSDIFVHERPEAV